MRKALLPVMLCAAMFVVFFAPIALAPAARAQTTSGNMTVAVTVVYPPAAPSNLVASTTSYSSINLTWTDNSNNEEGFVIEESVNNDSLFTAIDTVGANVTSYSRTGLLPDTVYFYRVAAYNAAGYGTFSNEASSTTASLPAGSCTPGDTQPCTSGANSCGMTNTGIETCQNTYTWGSCSASTPSNNACPSNGGGGGGGGGGFSVLPAPAPVQANVTISGAAYPLSTVTILQDSAIAVQTIAGPDGNFTATVNNLSGGSYVFSVYASDSNGNRSSLFTFPVTLSVGASTQITGVFLSPTLALDKQEVKQGDPLVIFGAATPGSQVTINVHSSQTIVANATANKNGAYVYDLNTAPLQMGSHSAGSYAQLANLISAGSINKSFTVGTQDIAAPTSTSQCQLRGDLNDDCRVNLVDFSILAYWYGRSGFPAGYNLDGGATIDLRDFSIMAYYWTG